MRRTRMTVAATALAGALLTGCGSGDGGGTGTGPDHKGGSGASRGAAPVKLAVPPEYDGGKGWDQEIDWVPQDADVDPVTTDGETVAYIIRSGNGYAVQARDGATGKVRWTSASYRTPAVDSQDRIAVDTPRLTTVRQGGRSYFAAWAVGEQPGDALTKNQELTQINIYPADSSGSSVAPLHHVSVPVSTLRSGPVKVRDSGAGLLVMWNSTPPGSATVDAATGKVTGYDEEHPFNCGSDCSFDGVVAVTRKGPVVNATSQGFLVPGGWTSSDIAPKNVNDGTFFGVDHGMFVVHWRSADVWSVHDLQSGRLLASTACDNGLEYNEYSPITSPNGTYLAFGSVVFDVKTGKGLCQAGDKTRRSFKIAALADDGTAYGVPDDETRYGVAKDTPGPTPVVELNVSTGSPKALPQGTLAPVATLNGGAVFTQRENGAGLRLSVRQKR
ncbi:hypothetical protein ABT186_15660 [Streptomyces sp. NPDC001634]|uniref:hypothetical protein n=1 Tax=Streptomyces sp. NPDC001634 TaxID=3154390 RepID=UPI0033188C3A